LASVANTEYRLKKLNSIPKRSPTVVSRLLDQEMVLVHPVQGKVRVLNPVGARVWELVDGRRTLDEIVRVIASEYSVDASRVQADVDFFCADLVQRGVLLFDS
jgi:hypothetical protein